MREGNRAVALENLSLRLDDIMSWNLCNMLKFNLSKTEIIQFSSRFSPAEPMLRLQSMIIMFSLLVLLKTSQNSHLTLVSHVKNTLAFVSCALAFVSCYWQNQKIPFASGY